MTPTQRAAMQQALDAMEDCRDGCEESHNTVSAITALREALLEELSEVVFRGPDRDLALKFIKDAE